MLLISELAITGKSNAVLSSFAQAGCFFEVVHFSFLVFILTILTEMSSFFNNIDSDIVIATVLWEKYNEAYTFF